MEDKKHLLVIDDDSDILDLLGYNLSLEGFKVTCVSTGEKGIEVALKKSPDLILLDIMLPGMDGFDVLKQLTSNSISQNIPVIFLSAKSEETDIVLGLELGAEDYVTKPFSIKVLISRIYAVLRYSPEKEIKNDEIIKVGNLFLFPGRRKVTFNGKPVKFTNVEFTILELLAKKPGWVFSNTEIMDCIHEDGQKFSKNSINVHIHAIRKKLGTGKNCLETVHGAGYRIAD